MANIIGQLKAVLGLDKKKFDQGLKSAEKSSNKFMSALKKIGGVIAAAFAVRKILQWGKALLGLTDVQAKAEQSLLVALKGRRDIQQSIIKQAQQLQKVTLFGDEQSIEAASRLAQLLGEDEEAISRLLPLVQDLATAKFGGNLVSAADLVAKSVGSSTNALSRYGITIEGAVGSSERLESAIEALNQQVGGQAQAAAEVGTGGITQLKNVWGDYKEYLGSKLLPVMNKISGWAMNFIDRISPKQSEVLRKEKIEVNTLVGAITNENISREARKSLIEELQKKYPDFLGNLNAETATNEDLRDRLKEVNEQYENKIKLAVQEELVYRQRKKYADSLEKEEKAAQKLAETQRLLERTQEDINKETDPDILAALIDKQNIYEGTVDRLTKKIQKEQEYREELNEEIKRQVALLGVLEGKAGEGQPATPKAPGITRESIFKLPAPSIENIDLGLSKNMPGLQEFQEIVKDTNEEITKSFNETFEDISASAIMATGVMSDAFEAAKNKELNTLEEVARRSGMSEEKLAKRKDEINRKYAEKQKAIAVSEAVINGALGITKAFAQTGVMGFVTAGLVAAATAAQIAVINAQGFAEGGVVPMGYPSDTYPAMLSSGERVLTPSENRTYESGSANKLDVYFHGDLDGTKIVWLVDEIKRRTNRTT